MQGHWDDFQNSADAVRFMDELKAAAADEGESTETDVDQFFENLPSIVGSALEVVKPEALEVVKPEAMKLSKSRRKKRQKHRNLEIVKDEGVEQNHLEQEMQELWGPMLPHHSAADSGSTGAKLTEEATAANAVAEAAVVETGTGATAAPARPSATETDNSEDVFAAEATAANAVTEAASAETGTGVATAARDAPLVARATTATAATKAIRQFQG